MVVCLQNIVAGAAKGQPNNNAGWFCSDMHGECDTITYQAKRRARQLLKGGSTSTPDLRRAIAPPTWVKLQVPLC